MAAKLALTRPYLLMIAHNRLHADVGREAKGVYLAGQLVQIVQLWECTSLARLSRPQFCSGGLSAFQNCLRELAGGATQTSAQARDGNAQITFVAQCDPSRTAVGAHACTVFNGSAARAPKGRAARHQCSSVSEGAIRFISQNRFTDV